MSQIRLQSENDSSNSRCGWAASYLLRLSSQHAASTPRLPAPRHPCTLQGPDWALHAQATRVGSSSTASSRAGETAGEKKTVPFPAAASLFLPLPCSFSTRYPADHTAGNHGPSHVCFVPRGGPRDKPAAGSHTQHPLPSVLPVLPAGSLVTPPEERDTRLSCSRVRRGTAHRASAQETAAPRATARTRAPGPVLVCLVSPQLQSPVPSAPVNRYPNSSGTVTEELGPHLLPGHRKHHPDPRQAWWLAWWLGAWAPDPTCAGPWLGRRPAKGQRPVLIATCSPNREGVVTTQSPVAGLLGAHPRPRLSSTHTWFLGFKRQTYRLERDEPPPNSQAVTSYRLRYKFQTSLDNEGEGPPLGSWFPQRWTY